MKREVMEAAGLAIFAEIGIIIFMVVFLALVLRVVFMSKHDADEMGRIPLEDGDPKGLDGSEVLV